MKGPDASPPTAHDAASLDCEIRALADSVRTAGIPMLPAHVAGHPSERTDMAAEPLACPASRAKYPRPATRTLSASG